ncbi:MAG: hypothetical protein HFH54_02910 [Lachnospiraceae bacterium]|nr:hypothetical protein [Lachnospiraceae bacterium]
MRKVSVSVLERRNICDSSEYVEVIWMIVIKNKIRGMIWKILKKEVIKIYGDVLGENRNS